MHFSSVRGSKLNSARLSSVEIWFRLAKIKNLQRHTELLSVALNSWRKSH